MLKESKEKQEIWELKRQVTGLTRQLNATESNNARLKRERDEAVKARYADQEAADIASQQLAAKTAEAKALGILADNNNAVVTEITALRPQLTEMQAANINLTVQAEIDHGLIAQLRTDNKALRTELDRRENVDAENAGLRAGLKDWKKQAHLYSSQAGSLLVETGRAPMRTYIKTLALASIERLPILGPASLDVLSLLHLNYYQSKHHKPDKPG